MLHLKLIICSDCEKGILTAVAEVGVEAHGTRGIFQSFPAAQGRVYRCDNCGNLKKPGSYQTYAYLIKNSVWLKYSHG